MVGRRTHEPQVLQATPHIVGHIPSVLGHEIDKYQVNKLESADLQRG